MTFTANYWKSDELSPEALRGMLDRNNMRIFDMILHESDTIEYNEDENKIVMTYDCDKFGIELMGMNEVFKDLVNDELKHSSMYTPAFIYDQLLKGIKRRMGDSLTSMGRSTANDFIWKVIQYIGAERHYSGGVSDDVWERIHNNE